MENLREKVQEFFVEGYASDLDSFRPDELKYIVDYMDELNQKRGIFKISQITNDEQQLRIEVISSTTHFKK